MARRAAGDSGRKRVARSVRPGAAKRGRRPPVARPPEEPPEPPRDPREVPPELLLRRCDLSPLGFASSDTLPAFDGILGQPRAEAAMEFGLAMSRDGFNVFALGADGTGRHFLVRSYVTRAAAGRTRPQDWCYVFNFAEPGRPRALGLPAGRGAQLKREMAELVEAVTAALAAAFQSEEFQTRREVIEQEAREHQEQALAAVADEARRRDVAAVRTPMGIVFAPLVGGEVAAPDVFEKLAEEEKRRFAEAIEEMQGKLQRLMRQQPRWQAERRSKLQALRREVTRFAVEPLIDELRTTFADLPAVLEHLAAVQADMEGQAKAFLGGQAAGEEEGPGGGEALASLRRYQVNLLVDNAEASGAPVLEEENPTFPNLLGRIEHQAQMGNLVTDFTLIRAGALHRANGGFLVLDALQVLRQPYAWDGLKRALESRRLRIEPLAQALGLSGAATLEPEPIPLEVKVVLVGDRQLYYLLAAYDADFGRLFKVAADFEEAIERDGENEARFAGLVGRLAREEGLRPLERAAVERVVEEASRLAGDRERLSLHTSAIVDLLREADLLAGPQAARVGRTEVERAVAAQVYRQDRLRERVVESLRRGTLLVATDGAVCGQVNGLVVLQLGSFSFGHPARITARVRLGEGEVVNIEREAELSGPLHSKGVLILTGFLGERFARRRPLALAASLVLEQSYGGVDGDSASLAELCALLSGIGGVPLDQSLALTGSVDQRGQAQPIGGVNEKIEGFFDTCRARGLTGRQGVIVPYANLQNLALRRDVVAAVEQGTFRVFAVRDVDETLELLSGLPAGRRGDDGLFPEGSFNRLVEDRLAELAALRAEQGPLARRGSGG